LRFDSVVFADSASLAALSCIARLKSERAAGRKTLMVPLLQNAGAPAIEERGLATVRGLQDIEAEGGGSGSSRPFRERVSVVIRKFDPRHVMAPLGLMAAPQAFDYFSTLRAALNVDKGRDLLFFEERPHALVPEAVPLRLSALGIRLPPAIKLKSRYRYAPFRLRLLSGLVPPIFGGLRERFRLSGSLKASFKEVADWDPQRALGPKLQPVTEPWSDEDSTDLFGLATVLGVEVGLGSPKAFKRRMARHAAGTGSASPIERYWLSLPGEQQSDPSSDSY
jgi:hypothetical protein